MFAIQCTFCIATSKINHKMKLSVWLIVGVVLFISCGVLIYWYVVASQDKVNKSKHACIVEYLKSKGKLDNSFPSVNASQCDMAEVIRIERATIRRNVENNYLIFTILPHHNCLLAKLDEIETVDIALKVAAVRYTDSLTKTVNDTLWDSLRKEREQRKEVIRNECTSRTRNYELMGVDFDFNFEPFSGW